MYLRRIAASALIAAMTLTPALAQAPRDLPPTYPLMPTYKSDTIGPFNAEFPAGGDGLTQAVPGFTEKDEWPVSGAWTFYAWVKPVRQEKGVAVIAALGDPASKSRRALLQDGAAIGVELNGEARFAPKNALPLGGWSFVVWSHDGNANTLSVNGKVVLSTQMTEATPPKAQLGMGLRQAGQGRFIGRIAQLTITPKILSKDDLSQLDKQAPNEALMAFQTGSPKWPISLRHTAGLYQPQPAWTLPVGKARFSAPVAKPVIAIPELTPAADQRLTLNGWRLVEAPKVGVDGAKLSMPGFDARQWYPATVPGTVLTTLVDRGVYPDPTYGLNNMAIPETLNKQSYWYRTEFTAPLTLKGRRSFLNLNGVNYSAEVWLNGQPLGQLVGAFQRGVFDMTDLAKPGERNSVAVRINPPPHPGIANEQSLRSGRGDNGGILTMDGPTFGATEGWDWIPGIRDRNMGLWQDVQISTVGEVALGDTQFVTTLPNKDPSLAKLEITVPVRNLSAASQKAEVTVAFDDITVTQVVTLDANGRAEVRFKPEAYAKLAIRDPKLWWPNGYGAPNLYTAKISVAINGAVTDEKRVRFGMREVTYEMSLMDKADDLRRVLLNPTKGRELGIAVMEQSHEHLRKVPNGWAASLKPEAEHSAAVEAISGDEGLSPSLVIRVNGVRIAARGGNIGMDDLMKRVDKARLEPYFRLHRDAHLNVIRNWYGQNTEESFYQLADENGLMVLNDFWESTTNNNIEAEDVPLFMANALDTIERFGHHPSIVLWFGRNEGVPQPILNMALQKLIETKDGTRLYMGSSNDINLAGSGPYNWREPVGYFTEYAKGFAVEIGTPSFPTLEAWQRAIPAEDRWPINDTWAYHDWHQDRAASVASFMEALKTRFGEGTSLEDFERKAQMLEYESYRAIFEGFNAGLWTTNSARMLWMTGPAWPSAHWQFFSSDFDTHGAFYGVKKASEQLHVQMNLPDHRVIVVNNQLKALSDLNVRVRIYGLDGALRNERQAVITARAEGVTDAFGLNLDQDMQKGPVLVTLEARQGDGPPLSSNFYWQARDPSELQALNQLAKVAVTTTARLEADDVDNIIRLSLRNATSTPALMIKLGLFGGDGAQVLPAYFSDNYVSLMPGESREIEIRYPKTTKASEVRLRGWNITATREPLKP